MHLNTDSYFIFIPESQVILQLSHPKDLWGTYAQLKCFEVLTDIRVTDNPVMEKFRGAAAAVFLRVEGV